MLRGTWSDAETDLDQFRDYTMKKNRITSTFPEQENTVKTYCIEGMPYETPFNFSTSMSTNQGNVGGWFAEEAAEKGDRNKSLIFVIE